MSNEPPGQPSGPMKKPLSLGDIAAEAGVSRTTVSYALRNHPGIPQPTRERIKKIAHKMGYVPDPRMAFKMDKVRGAKQRATVPIAWLNMDKDRNVWNEKPYLSPYIEGARERCAEMGYRLEEFWGRQPGMTMRRISSILYARGIQGIIIAPSGFQSIGHVRLDWKHFAAVSFDKGILAPRLHRVAPDYFYNMLLSLKILRRAGYKRIGVVLSQITERRSLHAYAGGTAYFHSLVPASERVPPLFYHHRDAIPRFGDKFFRWMEKSKPDAIICHDSGMIESLKARGVRVPDDIGVMHLGVEDDVRDWTGIWQRKREIGSQAAEAVISLIQNYRFGLQDPSLDMLVQGRWHAGRTLLVPKPGLQAKNIPRKSAARRRKSDG